MRNGQHRSEETYRWFRCECERLITHVLNHVYIFRAVLYYSSIFVFVLVNAFWTFYFLTLVVLKIMTNFCHLGSFFRPYTCSFQWFLCPPRLDPTSFDLILRFYQLKVVVELNTNGASFTTSITTFPLNMFSIPFWFCFFSHQNTLLWTSVYWNTYSSDLYKTKSTFSQSWLQFFFLKRYHLKK